MSDTSSVYELKNLIDAIEEMEKNQDILETD